MKRRKETI